MDLPNPEMIIILFIITINTNSAFPLPNIEYIALPGEIPERAIQNSVMSISILPNPAHKPPYQHLGDEQITEGKTIGRLLPKAQLLTHEHHITATHTSVPLLYK